MNNELVSVILPTYNRRKTIKRAIDSVLNQTYQNIELIIVDDHSTDGTLDLISELYGNDDRILYIMNDTNLGASKARNIGAGSAHGEMIAFHDSDDVWHPDKLEKQMAIMENAGDDVGMVYCQFMLHSNNGVRNVWPSEDIPMESKSGNILPYVLMVPLCGTPTMLIRKKYFFEAGGFSTDINSLEDYEFSIRFSTKYHVLLCNEPLVDAYESENSVGKQNNEKIRVECLIMQVYRDQLEKYGLRKSKMISVWDDAKKCNGIEIIEDNIRMILSDKEYGQTFAQLEGLRLSKIFEGAKFHIAVFLNDEDIIFGNGTRPERGNNGMEESRYELLLLIRYLAKRENNIAVTVYHLNSKNILPYDVKSVIINDKYEAVKRCKEDSLNCMIFNIDSDNGWYREIEKYDVPCICLQTGRSALNDSKFIEHLSQNHYIKRIVCSDQQTYEAYTDHIKQDKVICLEKITHQNYSQILEQWEILLASLPF